MSALSIQPTYPIFTDIDGQPLEYGYIWIGVANLDPQTNPINVYWDAALTLPAAQPIRTLAGYPANSGTPARLYVNSDYSIRVQNRNGSTVYSAPTPTEEYTGLISPFNGNFVAERFTAGFGTAADYPKAGLHINKTATNHAHYGVLDDTVYDFTGATDPIIGSASYNDNSRTQGDHSLDHHHSFQSYPRVEMTAGIVNVLSSFWSLMSVVSGTVSEASGLKVNNPSGVGTITNLYGVKIEDLTRGANNWAFFSAGNDARSYFGGGVEIGRGSTSYASFKYAADGTTTIKGRNDSGGFPIRLNTQTVRLGSNESVTTFDAVIANSIANGNLEITPRIDYGTHLVSGNLGLGVDPTPVNMAIQVKRANSSAGIALENTAGPNHWLIQAAEEGVANTGLGFRDVTAGANRLVIDSSGNTRPGADNTLSIGTAARRWSVVYAGTGTINTSDEREKQDIAALDAAEKRVAVAVKGMVKKFRFKDAVQAKGDGARIHIGVIAQEVASAFEVEGLDPMRYGIICYDEWPTQQETRDENGNILQSYVEGGNRFGVRHDELLAFIISAM